MSGPASPSTSGKDDASNVLYIGHLPHGFYEDQLRGFFSQFGTIEKLRVSRNKKTGKAKHYAFIRFQSAEVAAIAAEAMDGYMLFAQKLAVRVVPQKEVHKDLFKGANRKFSVIPWRKLEISRQDAPRTQEQQAARRARAIRRDKDRVRKMREAGIEYEYPTLTAPRAEKAKHTVFAG